MTDNQNQNKPSSGGVRTRVAKRAKRLLGSTLEIFGLHTDGRLISPRGEVDEDVAARVQAADEMDDRARLAITEAEIATERREKQQAESRPAPLKG